jgi:signal transduction histidine kinase
MRSVVGANTKPTPDALPLPNVDALSCEWDRDLLSAGLEPGLPTLYRIALSVLALIILGGAVVAALLQSKPGANVDPVGLALVVVSGVPWLLWALRDDNGPSWSVAVFVLIPIAVLGFGRWSDVPLSLGSDLAYYMATFPALWLVLLYTAFALPRMAIGVAVAALTGFAVPLVAGWASGQLAVVVIGPVIWLISSFFCLAAGYAIRFSYIANRRIAEARESLARQTAANERRRIAQDVHDVVAHTLAITMLHITAARMAVRRSSPDEAEEALVEAERHGRASLNDIRRIVRLLRSDDATAVDAAQPGLADVEALTASYRAAGLPVKLSLSIDGQSRSPSAELALYRVLQDALANAARHGSGPATVDLQVSGDAMSLNVVNPIPQPPVHPSHGSGLIGMKERILATGGSIETGARNGHWIVQAVVPGGAAS